MQTYTISNQTKLPIPVNFYPNDNKEKLLFFVGGSGDGKDKFNPLIDRILNNEHFERSIASLTYRVLIDESDLSLNREVADLTEVLDHLIEKGVTDIAIFCTSRGAFCTSLILTNKKYDSYLSKAILFDPADYVLENGKKNETLSACKGFEKYKPESPTAAEQLENISSDVKVNVVSLTIRNLTTKGYAQNRAEDNLKYFPRLNNDMVKAFYNHLQKKNKGKYLEENTIPHAFIRDGKLEHNLQKIEEIIVNLLSV